MKSKSLYLVIKYRKSIYIYSNIYYLSIPSFCLRRQPTKFQNSIGTIAILKGQIMTFKLWRGSRGKRDEDLLFEHYENDIELCES